jgi:hypothetical protein
MAVNEGSIKESEGVCNGGMAWVKYPDHRANKLALSLATLGTGI